MLKRRWFSAVNVAVAAIALSAIDLSAVEEEKRVARVRMRDGVMLSTNVFRPAGSGRLPVLLIRTPYGKGKVLLPGYRVFIDRGFAVVVQDVRGRFESEGVFRPLTQEERDGSDTLDWIARQPWCDGNIGMLGGSYVGITQWNAARSGNPHLKAIFPVVSGYDEYLDRFYARGGAVKLGHRLSWIAENLRLPGYPRSEFRNYVSHVPIRSADRVATGRTVALWQEAMNHPSYDNYWRQRSTRERLDRVNVPVFSVTGWYDNFAQSDLEAFTALQARSSAHRIVVGPWPHNMSMPFPGVDFGPSSSAPVRRYQLEWFTQWLKRRPASAPLANAPVRIFVMGTNQWRDEQEWPLARTRYTPFYLSADESGRSLLPVPGAPSFDEFVYDPRNPVPTRGGALCCNPKIFPWGPMDQRGVEARPDVLVYTSPVLKAPVEVTGLVRAVLHVATSAPDTDFTAKLVDVFPDGHARNLTDGILRLRYRRSLETPLLAAPGEVYRIVIDAGVTSNVFLPGHRIRLEVSSSNFPRFDRNPNTGTPVADERNTRIARQTVHHGRRFPSHLLLPVIP